MDLTLSDMQRQILDSVDRILERTTDWHRAIELVQAGQYDQTLHQALDQGGFLNLVLEGGGPLDAALVVERVAERPGIVATAGTALVYPMVAGRIARGPVGLAGATGAPFRMASSARTVLILDGDEARELDVENGDIVPVDNDRCGWTLGRLTPAATARAVRIGAGSGQALRNWWRVGLALEAAGAMRGAIADTTQFVKDRFQFGRAIGSFQAIRHRLAQLVVLADGAYWLALRAAWRCEEATASAAATHAAASTPTVLRETQQMHGAMGFTREYPLHLWSMRLPALQRELGGLTAHARDLAKAISAPRGGATALEE